MSNQNGWIPWNDRTDLENVFLFVTIELEGAVSDEYLETVGILGISEGVPCYSKTSVIFHLGKIPDKYLLDNIGEIAWGEFSLDCRSHVRLEVLKESDISKVQKRVAENYRSYCKKNGFNNDWCYKKILEIVRDYESSDRESFYREKNNLSDKSASVSFVSDSPAVPAAPVASVPAVPANITSIRPYPQICVQDKEATSNFDDNGAAKTVVAISLARIADKQDSIDEKQDLTLEKMDSLPNDIVNALQKFMNGKIDSLDKIPDLNLDSGEWLIASEYAKTKNISIDTLKQGRSNVKKNNGNTKGLVAEDGSCGIHGKHVWRLGGYDNYNNEIYYYYIYGVDGKYTP